MGQLKTSCLVVPSEIAIACQTAIDAGWDGILKLDEKEFLVVGISYNAPSVGGGILQIAKLKAKRS
jgi:hypothetical protein